jgi:NAD+ synthetase
MNTSPLKIVLAQTNPIVGDLKKNAKKIIDIATQNENADLIIFPELALCGYPPDDLILHKNFTNNIKKYVQHIENETNNSIIFGSPWVDNDLIYNAAIHISDGKIQNIIHKTHLPNYGVFDEKRIFVKGNTNKPIIINDTKIGVAICEDLWFSDVASDLKDQGAELLISLNASPFEIGKQTQRENIIKQRVKETIIPHIYTNIVGGQDDLVFDGNSFIINENGQKIFEMRSFKEDVQTIEYPFQFSKEYKENSIHQNIYNALCLGLRDYVYKNGFEAILLGLSGGIDSALSAVIACDALGADNVHCVMMPSQYTSQESLHDAKQLADNLGCHYQSLPIDGVVQSFNQTLDNPDGLTAENIQSRVRGVLLMALSNQLGHMVLTTGNKSEMAVGYATIYGDMCGGFNALKDVYKTQVYDLSKWINRNYEIIPSNIITRPASAELRPDQTDQDSLPEYEILDGILEKLIERRMNISDITREGYDKNTVSHVYTLLKRNEYKRRQSALGTKITSMAFGRDRRMPITNKHNN